MVLSLDKFLHTVWNIFAASEHPSGVIDTCGGGGAIGSNSWGETSYECDIGNGRAWYYFFRDQNHHWKDEEVSGEGAWTAGKKFIYCTGET